MVLRDIENNCLTLPEAAIKYNVSVCRIQFWRRIARASGYDALYETKHTHACAQASCVCPAHCQPSSESGRASLPLAHFVAAVDGWVCFFPVCFGFRRKKKISLNELPLGRFSLHFSAQVSIKGTSLSVSNSFALNSSEGGVVIPD